MVCGIGLPILCGPFYTGYKQSMLTISVEKSRINLEHKLNLTTTY